MATKIFIRERRQIKKGEKKPRFRVIGVSGSDVKIYVDHIRKKELDRIRDESGADIVYIDAGKGAGDGGGKAQ